MTYRYSTILALLCLPAWLSAQITLESTWIAGLGDTVFMWEDTTNGGNLDIGSAAGNQQWDFSGLQEQENDGVILEDPSTAPLASNFPTADFVINDLDDSSHVFIESTSSYFDIVGVVEYDDMGNPQLPDVSINFRFLEFPSTFGSSYSRNNLVGVEKDTINVDPDGPGSHPNIDSLRVKVFFIEESEIDAWGELTLPSGTYLSLRQEYTQIIKVSYDFYGDGMWQPFTSLMLTLFGDTVEYDTNSITYRWWSDNPAATFMLAEVEIDSLGNTYDDVTWLAASPAPYVGVDDPGNGFSMDVFPNPAMNRLSVRLGEAQQINLTLIDALGRTVLSEQSNNTISELDVSSLPAGVYLLQVTDRNGRLLRFEKVEVSR